MATLRELPHTADIGFEVEAETLEGLFSLAGRGLVRALGASASDEGTDAGASEAAAEVEVRLERPDLERLLVAWLRELLHRSMQTGQVPEARSVEVGGGRAGDGGTLAGGGSGAVRLRARVAWRPAAGEPQREIKGITYHGLAVERREGDWHARVVLDV